MYLQFFWILFQKILNIIYAFWIIHALFKMENVLFHLEYNFREGLWTMKRLTKISCFFPRYNLFFLCSLSLSVIVAFCLSFDDNSITTDIEVMRVRHVCFTSYAQIIIIWDLCILVYGDILSWNWLIMVLASPWAFPMLLSCGRRWEKVSFWQLSFLCSSGQSSQRKISLIKSTDHTHPPPGLCRP